MEKPVRRPPDSWILPAQNLSIVEANASHRAGTNALQHWWNHVQFPGPEPHATQQPDAPSVASAHEPGIRWAQWLLLLAAAILLFPNLGYPLIDRDETRYAEIPREMLATGDWILPHLNFEPYYDKPPLMYWLCAISYTLFGVSEQSARLIPALSGMETLGATLWFGSRIFGRRVALLGGAVLLLSVGFLGASRMILIDGALTCLTTIGMFSAYEALRRPKFGWGWWTTASIAIGLAFLAKGPVSLALTIPPVLVFTWLTDDILKPQLGHWLLLLGIVVLVAGPWFAIVCRHDAQFAYEFFYRHNVSRFAGAFHAEPFWYFLPVVLIAGFPWSFLTLPYLGFLTSRSAESRRRRPRSIGFLVLWSSWCLAFFSASQCKLPTYILPAAPAMALMLGHYLEQLLFSPTQGKLWEFAIRRAPWLANATTCLVGIGFSGFALFTRLESPAIAMLAMAGWASLLAAAILLGRAPLNPRAGWIACVALTGILALFVLHREIPRYARSQTIFGPSTALTSDRSLDHQTPVATVDHEWSGVPFYLKRNNVRNFRDLSSPDLRQFAVQHERMVMVIRKQQDLAELRQLLPGQVLLTDLGERGPARLILATTITTNQSNASVARIGNSHEERR